MNKYSHEYVPDYPSEPEEARKSKAPLVILAAFVACGVLITVALINIDSLKTDIEGYRAEIAELQEIAVHLDEVEQQNDKLTKENDELAAENDGLTRENDELAAENIKLDAENEVLIEANNELETMNAEELARIRWIEDAEKRPQPDSEFKITYYSTSQVYSHLIPGKTVAMNSQQVADLGLKRGDEIYVKSNRGWSGFYKITDSGCAYGTIDIYVNRGDIPHWGVEYGVRILI